MFRRRALLTALPILLVACSGGGAGTGPDTSGTGGGGGRAGDGGTTAFADVQALFATKCVSCHDPAHPVVPETQTYVALSLTTKDAYAALVNKAATETCGGTLVTPGDPSKSYLYAKITQDQPCDGQRMPHQSMVLTQPLPADQIAIVESWIRAGAPP